MAQWEKEEDRYFVSICSKKGIFQAVDAYIDPSGSEFKCALYSGAINQCALLNSLPEAKQWCQNSIRHILNNLLKDLDKDVVGDG